MKIIHTDKAPKVVGPYSQAVEIDGFVFCSGQIGIDPQKGALVEGIENQTHQVMKNIKEVLKSAGLNFGHVVKTTIYISDMSTYPTVNGIYGGYFPDHKPARSTVQVAGLPLGALVEIEVIASK